MTTGNRVREEMQALIEYEVTRSALRADDAAESLRIPVVAVTRLLDELVESGAAERLRPIGCDHSRHDHYRLLADPSVAAGPEAHMPPNSPRAASFARYPQQRRFILRRAAMCLATFLLLVVVALRTPADEAAHAGGDLKTLDGLVGRWMTLRTTIAEEKREWEARRKQWEEEIALLEQESATLKKEIDEGDTFSSSVEKNRAAALTRKERMEGELHKLRAVLDRAEADLRQWRARIPPGLMGSLDSVFDALPATQKDAEKAPLTKRAQTVAALYTQIETLQNRFYASRETLDVDGTRRQVDVLYVGLARAFAVSPANDWAAVGTPCNTNWTWSPSSRDAAAIRRALTVLNRQETACIVALPMQVAGGAKP